MLQITTKRELSQRSDDLARGLELVSYQNVLYIPADFETLDSSVPPDPARRVWLPLSDEDVGKLGNTVQNILFTSDSEERSYRKMVSQSSRQGRPKPGVVLVVNDGELAELHSDGKLYPPSQEFTPYFIQTPINNDPATKAYVGDTVRQWLGGEKEDLESLLRHLATVLAPHWSAVRYVLLIGEGRNGKSLLMKMLVDLFGQRNVSHVTRQDMSQKSAVCIDLSNKLLNVVFDGEAAYLKDSGTEKSLTAGDGTGIRRLYESHPTIVQTNGLFVEGLNREPKTNDKSSALQKRIIRFRLPNVYELNHEFENSMRSPEMLGAFLALLLEHYVTHHEVADKLKLTQTSREMKLEQMHVNSYAMQFLEYIDIEDPLGADGLLGDSLTQIASKFQQWRLMQNDINSWGVTEVTQLLMPLFVTTRKSARVNGRITKVRMVEGFKPDVIEFLEWIRGDEEEPDAGGEPALVEDGSVQPEPSDSTV